MLERMDGTQLGSIEARERRAGRSALARRAFCRAPQRSRQVVLERWRHVLAPASLAFQPRSHHPNACRR